MICGAIGRKERKLLDIQHENLPSKYILHKYVVHHTPSGVRVRDTYIIHSLGGQHSFSGDKSDRTGKSENTTFQCPN
jgi:hypothetical protein